MHDALIVISCQTVLIFVRTGEEVEQVNAQDRDEVSISQHTTFWQGNAFFPGTGLLDDSANMENIGFDSVNLENWGPQFDVTDWMAWDFIDPVLKTGTQHANYTGDTLPVDGPMPDSTSQPIARREYQSSPANTSNGLNTVTPGSTCNVDDVLEASTTLVGEEDDEIDPASVGLMLEIDSIFKVKVMSFAASDPADMDMLQLEDFGHVDPMTDTAYREIINGIANACSVNKVGDMTRVVSVPSKDLLDCFIQLYFEYFHHVFPIIHRPTFSTATCHWAELFAIATIGCRYSKASVAARCIKALTQDLRIVLSYTVSCPIHLCALRDQS
jgi:hypothetical protein